jgi:hypothetical protein
MIKVGAETLITGNLRRQHRYLESESTQQSGKQAIEFVTEPAATSLNYLLKQCFVVKNDRLARVDAEILERHRQQVRDLKAPQTFRRGVERPIVINSFQIRLDVHLISGNVGTI